MISYFLANEDFAHKTDDQLLKYDDLVYAKLLKSTQLTPKYTINSQ